MSGACAIELCSYPSFELVRSPLTGKDDVVGVQACLNAHADIHRREAGKMAELEKIREDAEARADVFDDTVNNLVRAKMAHATADVTLRAMRDQIEALSAQVPLENGVGTNSPNWRSRATAQAARWRTVAEPSVAAAVHKCAAQCLAFVKCTTVSALNFVLVGHSCLVY